MRFVLRARSILSRNKITDTKVLTCGQLDFLFSTQYILLCLCVRDMLYILLCLCLSMCVWHSVHYLVSLMSVCVTCCNCSVHYHVCLCVKCCTLSCVSMCVKCCTLSCVSVGVWHAVHYLVSVGVWHAVHSLVCVWHAVHYHVCL